MGGDIDPEAVVTARKNIRSAKLEDMIEISCKPMENWTDNPEDGVLVMNPPYGERLKPESMSDLYHSIGRCLKRNFNGWHAWIIGYKDEHFSDIGLKPSVKIPILNGSLECSLREYVLFNGRYNDFRADGGEIGHEKDSDGRRPMKMKRLTDDEWNAEARRFGNHGKDRHDDRRKDFKRDDRRDDRKKDFRRDDHRNDRKDNFRRDDLRKDFKRDDSRHDRKKDFRRDDDRRDDRRKDFGRDDRHDDRRKDFKREDRRDDRRKDFKREDRRDDLKKDFKREDSRRPFKREAASVPFRGPSIPEENATVFSETPMVSRKKWKKKSE